MKIYKETWQDADGLCLDITFTAIEAELLPYAYRFAKRNSLAEEHGFNIKNACRMRTIIIASDGENEE